MNRVRRYARREFQPGELQRALRDVGLGYGLAGATVQHTRRIGTDTEHVEALSFGDLWALPDATTKSLSVHDGSGGGVTLWEFEDQLCISGSFKDGTALDRCFEVLESQLGLVSHDVAFAQRLGEAARQAALSFEPPARAEPLVIPEHVTLRWLGEHVPLKLWGAAAAILLAVFVAGVVVGQTSLARELIRGWGGWNDPPAEQGAE